MSAAENVLSRISFRRSSFWTLTAGLFLLWTPVEGSLRLIGSDGPIRAAPGDDVVLPCRVEPEWDAARKTVEWSRPDLRAAGPRRRGAYVLVRRFQRTERDMMMETYVQRTSLSEAALRRGDASLSIRNVSLGDSGTFRCFIPTLGKDAEVRLVVDPNYVKVTPTETIPDRTPTSPTPQEETSRNALRSRLLLCCPVVFFILLLASLLICYLKKKTNFQKELLSQASTLKPGCLAQGLTCVDIEGSSKSSLLQIPEGSDSNQQDGHPGG